MMFYTVPINELARNLRLRKSGDGYHGACPVCGYKSGFELKMGRGKLLGYCHARRCDLTDFFRALYGGEGVPTGKGLRPLSVTEHDRIGPDEHFNTYYKIWYTQGRLAEGTLVETYLKSRGLTCHIPRSIAFLPSHQHTESGRYLPVMLARVNRIGSDDLVGIHRTFLNPDGSGKAPVEPNKKSLGNIRGGAVFLGNPGEWIGVSEGIENGLTFQQATGIATLAALSAGGMENLILPPLPLARNITVIADNDPVGLYAANRAADRWVSEGRNVTIMKPPEEGTDLNDLLIRSLNREAF